MGMVRIVQRLKEGVEREGQEQEQKQKEEEREEGEEEEGWSEIERFSRDKGEKEKMGQRRSKKQ